MRARGAEKRASLLAHTRASRTGKISVEPRCSYRLRRSTPRCCTKLARWRQSYTPRGASCGTSNRMACCTTRRRKSRLGRRYRPCGARCRRHLVLVGLAGSELIRAGQHYQLTNAPGSLRRSRLSGRRQPGARSQPGALIESEEQALAQTLEMVQHNRRAQPERANGRMLRRKRSACMAMALTRSISPTLARRVCRAEYRRQRGTRVIVRLSY
ncbi:Lactam utilization protein LamB [Klebsiella pneumoniae]|uniref:Lactam utilization protein LamB n=1 Tax=Klebsiella pneumoniae TaxID=573 RepID=A0A4P0XZ57_KLEPN|nr:Lactam utilization protein LamB [Klebsiella pneumoniae]